LSDAPEFSICLPFWAVFISLLFALPSTIAIRVKKEHIHQPLAVNFDADEDDNADQFLFTTLAYCASNSKWQIYINGLTQDQKDQLLGLHNQYRQVTAQGETPNFPPAQNMLQMYWDPTLEVNAQAWASNCNYAHNTGPERKANTEFWCVGQNIAIITSTTQIPVDLTHMFFQWYNEYKSYNSSFPAPISNYTFYDPTSHVTQLMWANTQAVACGFSGYYDGKNYHNFLVCNYGPGGNVIKQKIYIQGTFNPSTCAKGASTQYSSLCAPLG